MTSRRPDRRAPRIAILGFGSLLWDPENLTPHVARAAGGEPIWLMNAGPWLPLEFSRVSPKRLGGLALVVDLAHGALCPTHAALFEGAQGAGAAEALDAAAEALAARERAPLGRIGRAPAPDLAARPGGARVAAWLPESGFDGAVWTDLRPNFFDATGATFSIARALAHVHGLSGPARAEAVRYVARAPAATRTRFRAAFDADPTLAAEAAAELAS